MVPTQMACTSRYVDGAIYGYINSNIVFVANPSIQHGLHAGTEQISICNRRIYNCICCEPYQYGGKLGDTYGRKRMFVIGMAGFTITSALCVCTRPSNSDHYSSVSRTARYSYVSTSPILIQATFISKQKILL